MHGYTYSADLQADWAASNSSAAATPTASSSSSSSSSSNSRSARPAQVQLPLTALLSSQQMAQLAFEFVLRHMQDGSSGLWNWAVARDGRLLQSNKSIYGQWFVLYAFR
jgi:hypothetical protein